MGISYRGAGLLWGIFARGDLCQNKIRTCGEVNKAVLPLCDGGAATLASRDCLACLAAFAKVAAGASRADDAGERSFLSFNIENKAV